MSKKITLRFIGTDGWSRCVFKGNDENYYKTVELDPDEGFLKVSCTEQIALLQTLHTTDEPDGELSYLCKLENFIFNGINL